VEIEYVPLASNQEWKDPMRAPRWTREEIILATELYVRLERKVPSETHKDVVALSDYLNRLPIYAMHERGERFRNPSGVAMKISNIRHHDPNSPATGHAHGSKLDALLWDEFAGNEAALFEAAREVRATFGG